MIKLLQVRNEELGVRSYFMKKQSVKKFLKKAEPHRIFKNNLLSEKSIMLWRIRATAVLILYSFIDGGLFVFFPFFSTALGILGLSAYIFAIRFYFPLLYKHSGYFFENDIVSVNTGVFIYHESKIQVSKIQYCIILQGPIQRIFGLCSLRLLMAGSFESVSQITLINAYRLKNYIENRKQGEPNGEKKV